MTTAAAQRRVEKHRARRERRGEMDSYRQWMWKQYLPWIKAKCWIQKSAKVYIDGQILGTMV